MLQFPPVPSLVSKAPMATLNKIVQLFFEVVTETSALVVLEILLLDSLSTNDMVENYIGSLSESFPIPLSCHLLNLILNAAFKVPGQLQRWRILQLRLLSQSVKHRSCAISFLLPAIFKKFSSQSSLKISLQGNVYILSRNGIKKRIWECCKKLFSVLSLCLSSGSWTDGTESYVSEKDPV
ncbi:hypothetical protein Bca52824_083218 [Brassica carinata]|uniref:Uncharacterized protein n=1 Tax=Brassica carinata TaxID=52824 RepID=A0A8X7TSW1_BRACI|nr:hypothetical protein Bca52824_083218 [Brassica carinata]